MHPQCANYLHETAVLSDKELDYAENVAHPSFAPSLSAVSRRLIGGACIISTGKQGLFSGCSAVL